MNQELGDPVARAIIEKTLKEGEEILWQGKPVYKFTQEKWGVIILATILVVTTYLTVSSGDYGIIGQSLLGVLFVGGLGFMSYRKKIKKTDYFITDKRIIIFTEDGREDLPYYKIHKMERLISEGRIVFFDKPDVYFGDNDGERVYPQFEGLLEVSKVYSIIKKAYDGGSPSAFLVGELKELGEINQLTFSTQKNSSSLEGKLEGNIPIKISLTGKLPVKKLVVICTLPNPNDHFLFIGRESIVDNVKKVFGTQDLQMGDTHFDKTFLLQSDSKDFLKAVLTQEVKKSLLELNRLCEGAFQFAESRDLKPQNKTKKVKDHDDVLDLHLLERDAVGERLREIPANHSSPLAYACNFPSRIANNPVIISNIVSLVYRSIALLVKEVKAENL